MNKLLHVFAIGSMLSFAALTTQAQIVVTTSGSVIGEPPTISATDLGTTAFLSSEGTGGGQAVDKSTAMFSGSVGTNDTDNDDVATLDLDSTITLNLDTTVNTAGYDITGIDTIMGWFTDQGGRSNQGFAITLGFVDGGSATLVNAQHWAPNDPTQFWTTVSFAAEGTGGPLNSVTVDLDGAGPIADADTVATGVSSITWTITNPAIPGGVVVGREFDVFGTPTVSDGIALKGDVNRDGLVNFLDISPFITQLSTGDFLAEADCNCDNTVNFLDIAPFIGILAGN